MYLGQLLAWTVVFGQLQQGIFVIGQLRMKKRLRSINQN